MLMIVLRLLHIILGVFWAGAAFFAAMFLVPSVRAAGPAGGPVMRQLMEVRKYPIYATTFGLVTVITGLWMYFNDNSISNGSFARSHAGMTYGLGAVTAILTLVVGATIMGPTATKMAKLGAQIAGQGGPPNPEQQALIASYQAKLGLGVRLASILLIVTVITMAIGRYL
jgi:uncharacterized membrane protein